MIHFQRTPQDWKISVSSLLCIQKERGSSVLVVRPTLGGSGIALSVETNNAEAHANCIDTAHLCHKYTLNGRSLLPCYLTDI